MDFGVDFGTMPAAGVTATPTVTHAGFSSNLGTCCHGTFKRIKHINEYYHYQSLCLLSSSDFLRSQWQYPYMDTQSPDARTRSPDARRNRPHDPMTTPNDTPDDTTRRTDSTTDTDSTARSDRRTESNATTASPRTIPGRTPLTEEAGAPLVPTITTRRATGTRSPGSTPRTDTTQPTATDTRRPTRPPTDGERYAPLVPDLRPASRTRTDGGSR